MSIALDASQVLSFTQGGQTLETDADLALVNVTTDHAVNVMYLKFAYGTRAGSSFAAGPRAAAVTLRVDLTSGLVQDPSGAVLLTLGAGALASTVTAARNWRNTVEQFLVSNGLVNGQFVPWS